MGLAEPGLLRRVVNATRCSCMGLGQAWRTQAAFRYELYILLVVIPLAWVTGKSPIETAAEGAITILRDDRGARLKQVIDPIFDYEEMARRSLGAHWHRAQFDRVISKSSYEDLKKMLKEKPG